jgi:hypothetical protein
MKMDTDEFRNRSEIESISGWVRENDYWEGTPFIHLSNIY